MRFENSTGTSERRNEFNRPHPACDQPVTAFALPAPSSILANPAVAQALDHVRAQAIQFLTMAAPMAALGVVIYFYLG